jgi:4-amino-4-deoxy-L-arabinose transferase-like glycosyltransferase
MRDVRRMFVRLPAQAARAQLRALGVRRVAGAAGHVGRSRQAQQKDADERPHHSAFIFLFFWHLDGVGLIGPDEPRYASIGREMARSGDWITPRLWGDPWFEKPPLLYWMTAAGFTLGLGAEHAARLPVALLSCAFLAFFFLELRREFGVHAAAFATAVLGSSAAWLAYTRVAVTDLPLAATFSAAVLLCLAPTRRRLALAGALLGFAVLAKGLVPLILAIPLVWRLRRQVWIPAVTCLAVAAPWYGLVALRHGRAFVDEFFLEHHFGRFASEALRHEQPFWFFVPVLLAGLFPWTPLAALVRTRGDARRRTLALVVAFGFVFFSASRNKLPGYLLPLVPPAAALIGIAVAEAKRPRAWLAACAVLLAALPLAAAVLPVALERGITHASFSGAAWIAALPALAAAAVIALTHCRIRAVALIVAGMAAGAAWTASRTFPALDRSVSARAFWRENAARRDSLCVEKTHRSWRYNLNYYTVDPLPDCSAVPRPLRIEQAPRAGARITPP